MEGKTNTCLSGGRLNLWIRFSFFFFYRVRKGLTPASVSVYGAAFVRIQKSIPSPVVFSLLWQRAASTWWMALGKMNQAIDYHDHWNYLLLIQLHFLQVWKCCSCWLFAVVIVWNFILRSSLMEFFLKCVKGNINASCKSCSRVPSFCLAFSSAVNALLCPLTLLWFSL